MRKVHVEIRCEDCDVTDTDDADTCLCFLFDDKRGYTIINHGDLNLDHVATARMALRELDTKLRTAGNRRN